jgi:hypothetical protein
MRLEKQAGLAAQSNASLRSIVVAAAVGLKRRIGMPNMIAAHA